MRSTKGDRDRAHELAGLAGSSQRLPLGTHLDQGGELASNPPAAGNVRVNVGGRAEFPPLEWSIPTVFPTPNPTALDAVRRFISDLQRDVPNVPIQVIINIDTPSPQGTEKQ